VDETDAGFEMTFLNRQFDHLPLGKADVSRLEERTDYLPGNER
jgi:hypothetical protein